jgi:23S rRNA (pseudouridine1915-N3)-methyltransferase
MKVSMICTGKTDAGYLMEGINEYEKRIRHYCSFKLICLDEPRGLKKQPIFIQKEQEGRAVLQVLQKIDYPVLLDQRGRIYSSENFAGFIQQAMNRGTKELGFLIGGPWGFSDAVYDAVPDRISMSEMTFPHQLMRLLFIEQLYRAFTIIKGEAYHHPQ